MSVKALQNTKILDRHSLGEILTKARHREVSLDYISLEDLDLGHTVSNRGDVGFSNHIVRINFYNCLLSFARFNNSKLSYAIFQSAELLAAKFCDAQLMNANFKQALLLQADFTAAILYRADFTGADITDANFTGAKYDLKQFITAKNVSQAIFDAHNPTNDAAIKNAILELQNSQGFVGAIKAEFAQILAQFDFITKLSKEYVRPMVEAATPFVVNYMKFIQNNGEFAAAEACVTTSCVAEVQPKIDDFKVDESFRRAKLEEYYKIQQSSKKQVIGYFTGCVLGGTAAAAVALDDNVAASR